MGQAGNSQAAAGGEPGRKQVILLILCSCYGIMSLHIIDVEGIPWPLIEKVMIQIIKETPMMS